jgi:hypothetical protein
MRLLLAPFAINWEEECGLGVSIKRVLLYSESDGAPSTQVAKDGILAMDRGLLLECVTRMLWVSHKPIEKSGASAAAVALVLGQVLSCRMDGRQVAAAA